MRPAPIGLAGVMGGASTEISDTSTDVLVEAGDLGSGDDRAHRAPPQAAERGGASATSAGSTRGCRRSAPRGSSSCWSSSAAAPPTRSGTSRTTRWRRPRSSFPTGFVNALTGADYTDDETVAALTAIGAQRRGRRRTAGRVTPPTWRPDLTDAPTLVEEVARIVGYDRIPSVLPVAPPGRGLTREQRLRRSVAQALADAGLTEVLAYSVPRGRAERPLRPRRSRARCRRCRLANAARPAMRRMLRTIALPRPDPARAPQPVARADRPRAVRGRSGVPPGGRGRVRQRSAPGGRRAPRREDAGGAARQHPAAAVACRRAAGRGRRGASSPGQSAVPVSLARRARCRARSLAWTVDAPLRVVGGRAPGAAPRPHRRAVVGRGPGRHRGGAAAVIGRRARPAAGGRRCSSSISMRSSPPARPSTRRIRSRR